MGLRGPYPVGGDGETSRKGRTAHPEILITKLVTLWFSRLERVAASYHIRACWCRVDIFMLSFRR